MAASKASRPVQALLLLMALAAVSVAFVQNLSSAEQADESTAKLVTQMVPRFHINRPQIDDAASAALLDNYLKMLDPGRIYFLQSDYDQFVRISGLRPVSGARSRAVRRCRQDH